jgi:hypothetical protein
MGEFFSNSLNTFLVGLGLGLCLALLSLWHQWRIRAEFRRYKLMLSDRMELEARQTQEERQQRAKLQAEAENLRLQVARLNEKPDQRQARDLEIYARAERHMTLQAPGFAQAWELAKSEASAQLEAEERGASLPQRIYRRLLGGAVSPAQASLPSATAATGAGPSSS